MATFSSASKSSRLLQSKRYTILSSDFQEAYTSVLDLNASEIYTEEGGILTSSLPYSGSSQNGSFITSGSKNIAQFYYRLELSPASTITDISGTDKYLTWFALSGSDSDIGYLSASSAQVIQSNQATNWISNKYAEPSLAGNNAEATTPGYNILLSKGSGKVAADEVAAADYQFDYKTGVLQWVNSTAAPNAQASPGTNRLYLTGYQYVGQTLDEYISSGSSGGGGEPGGDNTQIQFNDSDNFGGDPRLVFQKSTGLTQLSGSFQITGSDDNIFLIKSGSVDLLRMSSSGALIFGELDHTPAPVAGGMFYSASNFYVGTD